MDWLEEIALRDNCPVDMILADRQLHEVSTDPRLGRADKVKRIRELIRRRRFPRLAAAEDMLQARIADLKLAPEIMLSAPPGLEGGRLRVEFSASSQQELRTLAERLAAAAEKDAAREAFALLAGAAGEPQTQPNQ
jgi:ParB family chromosome partitioning protein